MKFKEDISKFIFIEDKPSKADVIFVPGGSFPQPSEKAAELYKMGYAKWIMPSGRYSVLKGVFCGVSEKADKYCHNYSNEWDFMKDVLMQNGVPQSAILLENRAENTFQNSTYSKESILKAGITVKKAIICCKAQHARRCEMYYQLAFPEVEFLVCPVVVSEISADNWHKSKIGIDAVMGEILRIGQQFGNLL